MPINELSANSSNASSAADDRKKITKTDMGSKSGVDVSILYSGIGVIDYLTLLLNGTQALGNWDKITYTNTSATSKTFTFSFEGADQFYVDLTALEGDAVIQIRITYYLSLESGFDFLKEDGDKLLKEDAV